MARLPSFNKSPSFLNVIFTSTPSYSLVTIPERIIDTSKFFVISHIVDGRRRVYVRHDSTSTSPPPLNQIGSRPKYTCYSVCLTTIHTLTSRLPQFIYSSLHSRTVLVPPLLVLCTFQLPSLNGYPNVLRISLP